MTAPDRLEKKLKGLPLSGGVVLARVCMFNEQRHSNLPLYKVSDRPGVDGEIQRATDAIRVAGERLDTIRNRVEEKIGHAEAEIFVAQRMILEDPALIGQVVKVIETEGINAEAAVTHVLDAYESRLREFEDENLRERATEFGEIKRRLLDVLSNMKPSLQCDEKHCQKGRGRIVVAEELTPSLTVELDTEHIMGFATERGGRNSHAAILARALGVPAVSGLTGIRDLVGCGCEILVDGETGDVVIWPTAETAAERRRGHPPASDQPVASEPVAGLKVMANINVFSEVWEATAMQAEGIGLYRTEMAVLHQHYPPQEDELYEHYMTVVTAMNGRPVVFRLFDLGSDKPPSFLAMSREDNPALGWRGVRLLLGQPDLLRTQARAIVRASRGGPVDVLYPMIVDREQFLAVRQAFRESVAGLDSGPVRHGVMFEVPSACLEAREILAEADFGSIGTNDLIQYLYAVDRNNERVADDFRSDRETLWTLLRSVAAAAAEYGKPLSVCGELGGDPDYIRRWMDLGVESVSVPARRISSVRQVVVKVRSGGAATA